MSTHPGEVHSDARDALPWKPRGGESRLLKPALAQLSLGKCVTSALRHCRLARGDRRCGLRAALTMGDRARNCALKTLTTHSGL